MQGFLNFFSPGSQTRILDVGGYPWCWDEVSISSKITIANTHCIPGLAEKYAGKYEIVVADGTCLRYSENDFDIVFSNSVIEHLGTFEQQMRFASEARRVAKGIWIQTPANCFFMEPHLLTPFVHWLPRSAQAKLLRYGTVWGWIVRPNQKQVTDFLEEVRLLNRSEMEEMFPDCQINRESFLGMTKGYIAMRR
jgi:hypothetical protein